MRTSRLHPEIATAIVLLLIAPIGPPARAAAQEVEMRDGRRVLPHPIDEPDAYRRALERGTRAMDGRPGPGYWQQSAEYTLTARLEPDAKRLHGTAAITYHNNSPDTLTSLLLNLYQNLHAEGAIRTVPQEVTGGVQLTRVAAAGRTLETDVDEGPRYSVNGTQMRVHPGSPVPPDATIDLEIDWSFRVPQAGASGRMGWDSGNVFFIAYWYPQMAVYDDVVGWHTSQFTGGAEFYAGFAGYDLTVDVPDDWVVVSTGTLTNPEEVLAADVRERIRRAEGSDDVVHVITEEDFGAAATAESDDGRHRWHFVADSVRDVAFSVTRESFWDAARTPVGDRDGDGRTDYIRVDALYRASAPLWREAWRYAQHSIDFLSRFTGFAYPWPHMSAVEAGNIIGGGMEFPMMTLIGDYNARGDSALYYVTAHELAHMWVPMTVSNDERRYSWMDEGTTSFNENNARMEFYPGRNHHLPDQQDYIELARAGGEGPILLWSDHHYSGSAFGVASYDKPASLLVALRAVLGEETFNRAYHAFVDAWAFRHPYPWDLFNTFEAVSGRDLDWFWTSWYEETWTLDQAVAEVRTDGSGTRIVIEDRGRTPMPVLLRVTRRDGETLDLRIPVEVWLAGARSTEITVAPGEDIERVEIDPRRLFPDTNRENNVWTGR